MLFECMPPPLYSRTSGCEHLPHLNLVMRALGDFHAKWWNHGKRPPLEMYGHPADHCGVGRNLIKFASKTGLPALRLVFGDKYESVLAWKPLILKKLKWWVDQIHLPPFTLLHGDVHMDNIFFEESWPKGLKFIDFGNVQHGQAGFDIAYFLGSNLEPDVRRAHGDELMKTYHEQLLAGGVKGYTIEDCWRSYKLNLFRVLVNIMFVTYSDFRVSYRKKQGMFAPTPTPADAKMKETYDNVNRRLCASLVDAKFDELLQAGANVHDCCSCCVLCA